MNSTVNSSQSGTCALTPRTLWIDSDPIETVAEDPFLSILQNLPLLDLVNCSLVSKKWKKLSEDDRLWFLYAQVFTKLEGTDLQSKDISVKLAVKAHFVELFHEFIEWEGDIKFSDYVKKTLSSSTQKVLFAIAKLTAPILPHEVSANIKAFNLQPLSNRIEIGKLAVSKVASLWRYLPNYEIAPSTPQEKELYKDLLDYIFLRNVLELKTFSIKNLRRVFEPYLEVYKPGDISACSCNLDLYESSYIEICTIKDSLQSCIEITQNNFNMQREDLAWLQEILSTKANPISQESILEWFMTIASICSMDLQLKDYFKIHQAMLRKIADHYPNLHESLAKEWISVPYFNNKEGWAKLNKAAEGCMQAEMAAITLANFPKKGEKAYLNAIQSWKDEPYFKAQNTWTSLLDILIRLRQSSIGDDQKVALVAMLHTLPLKARLMGVKLMEDLLIFHGEAYLRVSGDLNALECAVEKVFQKKFNVHISNFSVNYQKTLSQWRNKEALMTYADKLRKLQDEDKKLALQLFSKLLTEILSGTYIQNRYDTTHNPHLAEIEGNHPQIFHKWQQSIKLEEAEIQLAAPGKNYQVIDTDDPNHILLMGTEVKNSAMDIFSGAKMKKSLLAYWLDGKHRLSLVCNAQGHILARILLRILIDKHGQPVLYQEGIFVADDSPDYFDLLNKLTVKKAVSMGIPLAIDMPNSNLEEGLKPSQLYELHAKAKPVPFEYVSALGGIQRDPYIISDTQLLYQPNS